MKLKLAENLELPEDAVTQKFGILGRSGSGKSYAAGKLTELLLDHKAQVVIVDPVGIHYGLRLAKNGKDPGYPIPVFGGQKGDIPLEPGAGILVADLVVDKSLSLILDVSEFTDGELRRFVTDFAKNLLHKKKQNRSPLMIIWEESQEFVPQHVFRQDAQMVGAMEKLIKIGRNFGIGTTLISQRPQAINKDVLNQTEALLVYQTTGPQERKAIEGWIVEHGLDKKAFVDELPGLPQGTGWLWSPQWLRKLEKIRVLPKITYDASATPKFDRQDRATVQLSPIDLEKIKQTMSSTIEKAKTEDPKELRRQIAELKKELASKPMAKPETKTVEVSVLKDYQIGHLEKLTGRLGEAIEELVNCVRKEFLPALQQAKAPIRTLIDTNPKAYPKPIKRSPILRVPIGSIDSKLPGPQQRILDALAWLESINISPAESPAVAFLAGYTTGGGAYNNPKGNLHSQGLIEYHQGGCLALTDAGRTLAHIQTSPLSASELQARVLDRLPGPERKILTVLIEAYPKDLPKEEVAQRSGYAMGGGAFSNPLGRLRSLGLIDYPMPGHVMALPVLFLER